MEHYRVMISANGRMVLPAGLRQQLHVERRAEAARE